MSKVHWACYCNLEMMSCFMSYGYNFGFLWYIHLVRDAEGAAWFRGARGGSQKYTLIEFMLIMFKTSGSTTFLHVCISFKISMYNCTFLKEIFPSACTINITLLLIYFIVLNLLMKYKYSRRRKRKKKCMNNNLNIVLLLLHNSILVLQIISRKA